MSNLPGSILNDTVLGASDSIFRSALSNTVLNPLGNWSPPSPSFGVSSASSLFDRASPAQMLPSFTGGSGSYATTSSGGGGWITIAFIAAAFIAVRIFNGSDTDGNSQQQYASQRTEQQVNINPRFLYAGYDLKYWVLGSRNSDDYGIARTGERFRLRGRVDANYDEIQFLDRPYDGERFVVKHSDMIGPSSMSGSPKKPMEHFASLGIGYGFDAAGTMTVSRITVQFHPLRSEETPTRGVKPVRDLA